ncbi:hypothetical protein [Wenyingzhuangia sp. IMCC45467]
MLNHYRAILLFKSRPDTYQIFEDITIENITGKCKEIISVSSWKQFFDMKNVEEQPYCIIKNINFNNINIDCQSIGSINGNPKDRVSNINFKNLNIKAKKNGINTSIKGINTENVFINGELYNYKRDNY